MAVALGHQDLHRLPQQFFAGVTEGRLGQPVQARDHPLLIDHHHGHRYAVKRLTEVLVQFDVFYAHCQYSEGSSLRCLPFLQRDSAAQHKRETATLHVKKSLSARDVRAPEYKQPRCAAQAPSR
ncbi:hypothetical protein FQZ97_1079090 [compost metagenome]